jgi:hypothetical protein
VPRHVEVSPDVAARRAFAFVLVTSSPSRPDRLVSGSPAAAIARHGFSCVGSSRGYVIRSDVFQTTSSAWTFPRLNVNRA